MSPSTWTASGRTRCRSMWRTTLLICNFAAASDKNPSAWHDLHGVENPAKHRSTWMTCRCADVQFKMMGSCVQELLYSYNIGVDRQKRQRQKLSDSARSVGLSLPDWTN